MLEELHRLSTIPSLNILDSELAEFARTGNKLHLLHAARALDDARAEMRALLTRECHLSADSSFAEGADER